MPTGIGTVSTHFGPKSSISTFASYWTHHPFVYGGSREVQHRFSKLIGAHFVSAGNSGANEERSNKRYGDLGSTKSGSRSVSMSVSGFNTMEASRGPRRLAAASSIEYFPRCANSLTGSVRLLTVMLIEECNLRCYKKHRDLMMKA